MVKLCVFDLDGTLVNTIADLASSLNHALAQYGYPTLNEQEVAAIVGHSVQYMCEHALPSEYIGDAPLVLEAYQAYYDAHCCDQSRAYDGMMRAVSRIRQSGVRVAAASNKPHAHAIKVLDALYPRDSFSLVIGRMAKFALKPAPDALRFVMDYFGVTPEETVYVGDSEVDIEFARNAGMRCLSVSWGFRTRLELIDAGATCIVDDPDELIERILE